MDAEKTPVLDHQAVLIKLERMACEICETHTDSDKLIICGMNQRGYYIAGQLSARVAQILPELKITLVQADAEKDPIQFLPQTDMAGQHVLLADDVINTGSTLMKVLQQIYSMKPSSIKTAFLAKREHRNYPVKADYVGVSLATTLQEHVVFNNSNPSALEVYLN